MYNVIQMMKGQSITVVLPSGTRISIEATADTADIVRDDRVLYSEELQYDGSNEWTMMWPKPENADETDNTD